MDGLICHLRAQLACFLLEHFEIVVVLIKLLQIHLAVILAAGEYLKNMADTSDSSFHVLICNVVRPSDIQQGKVNLHFCKER